MSLRRVSDGETTSIRELQALLLGVMARGADTAPVVAAAGLAFADLGDPDRRLTVGATLAAYAEAIRVTADPDFGLHMGEVVAGAPLPSVLRQALFASVNLGDAMRRLGRFTRILRPDGELRLDVTGETARFVHCPVEGPTSVTRHMAERVLASVFVGSRQQAGPAFVVREVTFRHGPPSSAAEHARVFAAPVRFGQPMDALAFDRVLLELPCAQADRDLLRVLDAHLEGLLPPDAEDDFLPAVRAAITATLPDGSPTVKVVAARMRIGSRTLRRRIAESQTSFRALVAGLRRELSEKHLSDETLGIGETAFALGFSEAAAFHRAFKKWTGHTPTHFRHLHRAG